MDLEQIAGFIYENSELMYPMYAESPKDKRRRHNKERQRMYRAKLSLEELEKRRDMDRERHRVMRANLTKEELEMRRAVDRERQRKARAKLSPQEIEYVKLTNRERQRMLRAKLPTDEIMKRRMKDRLHQREYRASLTPEQIEHIRAVNREKQRERRANLTLEELIKRRVEDRDRHRMMRMQQKGLFKVQVEQVYLQASSNNISRYVDEKVDDSNENFHFNGVQVKEERESNLFILNDGNINDINSIRIKKEIISDELKVETNKFEQVNHNELQMNENLFEINTNGLEIKQNEYEVGKHFEANSMNLEVDVPEYVNVLCKRVPKVKTEETKGGTVVNPESINLTHECVRKNFPINKTEVKQHNCTLCGYSTDNKYHLQYHLASHDDVRPYICDRCGKRFKQKFALNAHIKIHLEVKEYKCMECDYSCNRLIELHKHVPKHSGIGISRTYKCKSCGELFLERSLRKQHQMREHSTDENLLFDKLLFQRNESSERMLKAAES